MIRQFSSSDMQKMTWNIHDLIEEMMIPSKIIYPDF